ncbi:MAG TPA: TonB-dependent receptor, partial [Bacteroidia bacterium]|nr:TonB-dependent receptor [Bacteroidia bacterium]
MKKGIFTALSHSNGRRKLLLLTSLACLLAVDSIAQVTIKGVIKDSTSQETLVGVVVSADDTNSTTTDLNGAFKLKVQKGQHKIVYSYVTYRGASMQLYIDKDTVLHDIPLGSASQGLQAVVVSASMYEKNLAEEDVSMAVITPSAIENTGTHEMDDAINNVPGVSVINNQANIRGGSGWTYGAGSRVQILVDGLPELTADAADAIWDFLPMEETQQVEIIKGPASVMYGSSALDGVINIRTAFPTTTPVTKFDFFEGVYSNPNVKGDSLPWKGGQQPRFDGFNFMHSQILFNRLDLVCSGNLYSEQSYLQGAYDQRARVSLNLRYRFKKINGLMIGVRTSYMYQNTGTYLAWKNDTTGVLLPLGTSTSSSVVDGQFVRVAIDPYINYNAPDGSRITVQGRYFLSNNQDYGSNDGSIAELYYGELKYQKDIKYHLFHTEFNLTVTAGIATTLNNVESQLYGTHRGNNQAEYLQLDQKIGKRL